MPGCGPRTSFASLRLRARAVIGADPRRSPLDQIEGVQHRRVAVARPAHKWVRAEHLKVSERRLRW